MTKKVFIIAEAGVNHNGCLESAKKLVDAAATSGADAVKFQTFKTEKLVTIDAGKAEYQKKYTDSAESQFDMIKKLELDEASHKVLIEHCRERNILFLSSPFDLESIELLNKLELPLFKIPSGEITNLPYLRKIASYNKRTILSTGMSTLDEVREARDVLYSGGLAKGNLQVLHCTTEYPCPYEEVNLRAMNTIASELEVDVGYSDHTLGVEVPIAAVAMGAAVIEKHFTLSKDLEGPDHAASLNPEELCLMVKSIRNIEKSMGSRDKTPAPSEIKNMKIARKSIVASSKIIEGEIFCEQNLAIKRPGDGISPMQWDQVLGKKALRNYRQDEVIDGF